MLFRLMFKRYCFLCERFIYAFPFGVIMTKFKPVIPANVDPIKLADEIKGDMASEWLKRREKIKSKPLLVQQS